MTSEIMLSRQARSLPDARPRNEPRSRRDRLAPAWHTAVLVCSLLGVAVAGTLFAPRGVSPTAGAGDTRIIDVYLPLIVINWGLCIYVTRVGLRRSMLSRLIGRGSFGW